MERNNHISHVIRPVRESDLPDIYEISAQVGPSISLPKDKKTIQKKVERSIASFALKNKIEERLFFLVLEDVAEGKLLGTAAIESRAGSKKHPFYNYTIGYLGAISHVLHHATKHSVLYFGCNYQDASMLGTLYLTKKSRGLGLGQFLSRSRCLFIAQFPELFSDLIVANMRGVFDEQNISAFWKATGEIFFGMDFYKAYFLYSTQGPEMISDLAPKLPMYIDLLPKDAQVIIGKTHERTQAALHLLEKEGFVYRNVIDIFDAGPIIEVEKKDLKAIQESRMASIIEIVPHFEEDETEVTGTSVEKKRGTIFLVCNTSLDVRIAWGKIQIIAADKVRIEESLAKTLNVSLNEKIRYYAIGGQV